MKVVVGLGNPGKRYDATRHNIGFKVVERLADKAGVRFKKDWRATARVAKFAESGEEVLLVEPQTFMNRSGQAIRSLVDRHRVDEADVVVIFDDADLDCGRIRLRAQGGAGGHNGVRSVVESLGVSNFARVRVGVGPRPHGEELVEYVLSEFSSEELEKVTEAVDTAANAVMRIVTDGVERAMNEFN